MEHSFSRNQDMFMKNSVKLLLFTFVVSLVVACGGKKQEAPKDDGYINPRENTTMQRTSTDTLAVLYNVNTGVFFTPNTGTAMTTEEARVDDTSSQEEGGIAENE